MNVPYSNDLEPQPQREIEELARRTGLKKCPKVRISTITMEEMRRAGLGMGNGDGIQESSCAITIYEDALRQHFIKKFGATEEQLSSSYIFTFSVGVVALMFGARLFDQKYSHWLSWLSIFPWGRLNLYQTIRYHFAKSYHNRHRRECYEAFKKYRQAV